MRSILLFPLGLVVGAALAWAWLSADGVDDPEPTPARSAPERSAPPGGRVPGPLADPPAGGTADEETLPEELTGREAVVYHLSLAAADAVVGRREAAARDLDRAVEAGADGDQVGTLLVMLPERARALLMEVLLRDHPGLDFDRGEMVSAYLDAGERDKAIALIEEELRRREAAGEIFAVEGLVDTYVSLDPERAAATLLALAGRCEMDPELLLTVAGCLSGESRPDLARPFLLQALAADPGNEWGIEMLAEADPAAALDFALQGTRENPTSPGAWGRLGSIQSTLGNKAGAFEAYRQAATFETDQDDRREYLRGMLLADPVGALPVIEAFAEGADDETVGLLGRAYAANDRQKEAFDTFLRAHGQDATDSEWLHRMVSLDPARAIETFGRELSRMPETDNDELIGTLALAHLNSGNAAEAWAYYERAHAIDEEDWEWLRGLAAANPGKAVPILEERLETWPDEEETIGALADAYAGMGRKAEAVSLYEKIIRSNPDSHRWIAALAAVEPARGLPMLKSALDREPENDEIWGSLGDAYRSLGRMEEARQAYDRALELDPSDWEWSMRREQIR